MASVPTQHIRMAVVMPSARLEVDMLRVAFSMCWSRRSNVPSKPPSERQKIKSTG